MHNSTVSEVEECAPAALFSQWISFRWKQDAVCWSGNAQPAALVPSSKSPPKPRLCTTPNLAQILNHSVSTPRSCAAAPLGASLPWRGPALVLCLALCRTKHWFYYCCSIQPLPAAYPTTRLHNQRLMIGAGQILLPAQAPSAASVNGVEGIVHSVAECRSVFTGEFCSESK